MKLNLSIKIKEEQDRMSKNTKLFFYIYLDIYLRTYNKIGLHSRLHQIKIKINKNIFFLFYLFVYDRFSIISMFFFSNFYDKLSKIRKFICVNISLA